MIGTIETPKLSLGTIDLLLRDRDRMLIKIRTGNVNEILRTMIVTITIAMAIVGAALGSYRGGEQIFYAAIKLPLVLLGTAALSAPALTAIGTALGRTSRLAVDLALVMSALAFGALIVVAFTPLIMLGRTLEASYHEMILGTVAVFALGGIAALTMIVRAMSIEAGRGWRTAVASMCLVFVMVGGQLSWALRPYLVRPKTQEIVFVREVEGSLFDAVVGAVRSARGIYHRDHAPVPGHEAREVSP